MVTESLMFVERAVKKQSLVLFSQKSRFFLWRGEGLRVDLMMCLMFFVAENVLPFSKDKLFKRRRRAAGGFDDNGHLQS